MLRRLVGQRRVTRLPCGDCPWLSYAYSLSKPLGENVGDALSRVPVTEWVGDLTHGDIGVRFSEQFGGGFNDALSVCADQPPRLRFDQLLPLGHIAQHQHRLVER